MNDQWFWRTRDEIYGPCSEGELKRLAREGKLHDGDAVRLGEKGEWQSAADAVAALSEKDHHGVSDKLASDAAARVIADANRAALRRAVTGGETSRRNLILPLLTRIKGAGGSITSRLGDLIGMILERLTSRTGRIATLVVVLAVLGAALLRLAGLTESSFDEVHAQYVKLWREVRELRARSASEEEWDAFERRALDQLAPLVARLEEAQQLNPTNRDYWFASNRTKANVRMELILAGRSCFPTILRRGRNKEISAEGQLDKHMNRIAVYLDGLLIR